jgi:hypothetical protein
MGGPSSRLNVPNRVIHLLFFTIRVFSDDLFSRCLEVVMTIFAPGYDKTFSKGSLACVGLVSFITTAFGSNYWDGDWEIVCATTNMGVYL